jgi:hypothetical protein
VKVAYGMAIYSREINANVRGYQSLVVSQVCTISQLTSGVMSRILFCPCNTPLTDISPCIAWHSLSASCRAVFPSALHFVPKTDPCEDLDKRFNIVLVNVLGFSGTWPSICSSSRTAASHTPSWARQVQYGSCILQMSNKI